MQEIGQLVQKFDSHIVLSADHLYEKFGLENGTELLQNCFTQIRQMHYEDSLLVNHPEPLIEYILSCHGNQNQYLLDHYKEFREFVEKKQTGDFGSPKMPAFSSVRLPSDLQKLRCQSCGPLGVRSTLLFCNRKLREFPIANLISGEVKKHLKVTLRHLL